MNNKYYVLTSGGKDSMTMAHYLNSKGLLESCLSFDTGIHSDDWMGFMESLPYPLEMVKTPITYEETVREFGFPGRGKIWHEIYFNRLKDRAMDEFLRRHRDEEKLLVASGVRKRESKRRFRNTKRAGRWGRAYVDAPLYYWNTSDVWDYIRNHDVKITDCSMFCGISGDCLCGSYASVGERRALRKHSPAAFERILKLEEEVGGVWGMPKLPRKGLQGNMRFVCAGECDPRSIPVLEMAEWATSPRKVGPQP